jgi:hypothetical protein
MSRFMVSMIGDESFMEDADPKVMEKIVADMDRYNEELEKAGVAVGGDGLAPSSMARTLRYGEEGKTVVTDGPYTESKEQIGGYWIFECVDLDEAVEWARKAPLEGAAVEIRPIIETVEENVELFKEQAKS